MEHETNRRFEAWLDDERCVISFHSIPDDRFHRPGVRLLARDP